MHLTVKELQDIVRRIAAIEVQLESIGGDDHPIQATDVIRLRLERTRLRVQLFEGSRFLL